MGANFVLQKPISVLNASRCFHAALNFMIKERRRYFRQPVKMLVKVIYDGKTLNATSTNISEGGIAVMLREALPKGAAPASEVFAAGLPASTLKLRPKSPGSTSRASPDSDFITSRRFPRNTWNIGSTNRSNRNFQEPKIGWRPLNPKPRTKRQRRTLRHTTSPSDSATP